MYECVFSYTHFIHTSFHAHIHTLHLWASLFSMQTAQLSRAIWGSVSYPRTHGHAEWGRLGLNRRPSRLWMTPIPLAAPFISQILFWVYAIFSFCVHIHFWYEQFFLNEAPDHYGMARTRVRQSWKLQVRGGECPLSGGCAGTRLSRGGAILKGSAVNILVPDITGSFQRSWQTVLVSWGGPAAS